MPATQSGRVCEIKWRTSLSLLKYMVLVWLNRNVVAMRVCICLRERSSQKPIFCSIRLERIIGREAAMTNTAIDPNP